MADEAPKEAPAGIGVMPTADFAPAQRLEGLPVCKIHCCTLPTVCKRVPHGRSCFFNLHARTRRLARNEVTET
jgi:hypothetical protein